MSTEELKMVLEAIGQLGAAGKEAFVIWIVLKYTAMLLQAAMMLVAVLGVPFIIIRGFGRYSSYAATLAEIAKLCGLKYDEIQTYDGLNAPLIRKAVEVKVAK